ncbi:serine hydrolase domain-containing protein [Saccharothrix luteola]|uniref:serine hydrolase domain-containing protein n=1 Tax=Saccharothrix luteola TaxID=2893018 RepID=UPI001E282D91|nr:serine hydrolase domain-containing protein [Saccharothrix luteola]MCC8250403.1 beta-lactamase family protein [Saccharothrix luteola]
MTRPTSRRSVLLGALAGGALVAAPRSADATPGSADTAAPKDLRPGGAFDRFVAERAARDEFSGTVLLAHRGRPVLLRSHGLANRERRLPNGPDTVFCLASITKTFIAVAIAQLVQQGRMTFHDTLGAHLDGFPAEIADTVTVHHLLTHTSGIGRPALGVGPPQGLEWTSLDEVQDGTMAIIRRTPRQFAPGTRHTYSNDGFFVLGAIVARVSGQSVFDYVRRHVFRPAGMSRADFHGRPRVQTDDTIARPYWTLPSGARGDFITTPHAPFSYGPAGGAYATASDLLAFARALTADELLGPAFTGLVTGGKVALPPADPPGQAEFYGYGFRHTVTNGRRVIGHSGSGPGAATRLDVHPDLGWVVIVVSNYDTSVNPIVGLARQLVTA